MTIVARAEIVAWRVMWGSGGHFDPSNWWCEHRDACRAAVFDHIEVFYSRQRRHSALGYRTPEQAAMAS